MAATKSVLVTRQLPPLAAEQLRRLAVQHSLELREWPEANVQVPRTQLLSLVNGVSGILCMLTERIDTELLKAAGSQLQVVSTMSVGVDHIDLAACTSHGVTVGHTPDVLTDATADLTLALLLAACRRLPESISAAKNGQWGTWSPLWMCGRSLSGATVGIVGLGRIGQAVAARLQPFGISKLLYTGFSGPKSLGHMNAHNLPTFASLPSLLEQSDVVIATCELNEVTRLMFNASRFSQMKRGSIFVNTSRGGLVDQDALLEVLKSGHLWAAALDVTTPEPLPPTHPLFSQSNCIISPHIGSATIQTREDMARIAVENVIAGVTNKTLPFSVKSSL